VDLVDLDYSSSLRLFFVNYYCLSILLPTLAFIYLDSFVIQEQDPTLLLLRVFALSSSKLFRLDISATPMRRYLRRSNYLKKVLKI
jgi:hypothetical protein